MPILTFILFKNVLVNLDKHSDVNMLGMAILSSDNICQLEINDIISKMN